MKKHTWKIVFGIAAVLMIASIAYGQYASKAANEGVTLEDHIKGNPDATVTMTEYGDFQCPACGQFHPIVKSVIEQYGSQIRFEFKHFPLTAIHPHALSASKAAEAAGVQGKFFEMHDKLFENQKAWSASASPSAFYVQYAEELGLDVALFKQHMRASLIEEEIRKDQKEAEELGFTGTPSFLLNGEPLEFESFPEFMSKIESALGIVSTSTATTTAPASTGVEFGIPAAN
jgi:protein-disulfide isomerase